MKVSVDTSVYGGYFDSDHEYWTKIFFQEVDLAKKSLVTSALVSQEVVDAPDRVKKLFAKYEAKSEKVIIDDEVVDLAEKYIEESALLESHLAMPYTLQQHL